MERNKIIGSVCIAISVLLVLFGLALLGSMEETPRAIDLHAGLWLWPVLFFLLGWKKYRTGYFVRDPTTKPLTLKNKLGIALMVFVVVPLPSLATDPATTSSTLIFGFVVFFVGYWLYKEGR